MRSLSEGLWCFQPTPSSSIVQYSLPAPDMQPRDLLESLCHLMQLYPHHALGPRHNYSDLDMILRFVNQKYCLCAARTFW